MRSAYGCPPAYHLSGVQWSGLSPAGSGGPSETLHLAEASHPACFPALEPACPRGDPWIRPGSQEARGPGRSLGRDRVEPASEERSTGCFLGFLLSLSGGLDHSQMEPEPETGAVPGGCRAPASCPGWAGPAPHLGWITVAGPRERSGRGSDVTKGGRGARFPESTGGPHRPARGQVQMRGKSLEHALFWRSQLSAEGSVLTMLLRAPRVSGCFSVLAPLGSRDARSLPVSAGGVFGPAVGVTMASVLVKGQPCPPSPAAFLSPSL